MSVNAILMWISCGLGLLFLGRYLLGWALASRIRHINSEILQDYIEKLIASKRRGAYLGIILQHIPVTIAVNSMSGSYTLNISSTEEEWVKKSISFSQFKSIRHTISIGPNGRTIVRLDNISPQLMRTFTLELVQRIMLSSQKGELRVFKAF